MKRVFDLRGNFGIDKIVRKYKIEVIRERFLEVNEIKFGICVVRFGFVELSSL